MKRKLQILTACLAAVACSTALAVTQKSPSPAPSPKVSPSTKPKASPSTKTTPSPSPKPSAHPTATTRPLPFHGVISAADQKAKTFSVGKEKSRVFRVTDKTVVWKAGAAATMKDVVANEEVRGSYWKVIDGTLEAKTVKLGPKTDAEKAADEKAKAKKKEKEAAAESSASPSVSPKP